MSLSIENDLGKIKISESFYTQLIKECFCDDKCSGRIWPSSSKGRRIGYDSKLNANEIVSAIEIHIDDEGTINEMEVYVIIRFGTSIKNITRTLSDMIADSFKQYFGSKPKRITIHVTGVISKSLAKRNMEVTYDYET